VSPTWTSPGIGSAQDRELEKKLLANMRLADIDKLVQEAGPSEKSVATLEIGSARGKERSDVQPKPPDKPKRTSSGSGGATAASGTDMSLMTAMASRLRKAEEAASLLREDIKARDATIAELRACLVRRQETEAVRRSSSSSPPDALSSDADLSMVKDHNSKLRELLRKADTEK